MTLGVGTLVLFGCKILTELLLEQCLGRRIQMADDFRYLLYIGTGVFGSAGIYDCLHPVIERE